MEKSLQREIKERIPLYIHLKEIGKKPTVKRLMEKALTSSTILGLIKHIADLMA